MVARAKPARGEQLFKTVDWRNLVFRTEPTGAVPSWRWLPLWLVLGFGLRAFVALAGDFVLHPDEIYQHLEPAHAAVFGNGIIYWEFIYGARSWLVPGTVAILLWLSQLVGLSEPWFYVDFVKLFFCLLSLLIPWGTYHFSRAHLSENSARLALVLTCIWPFIVGYSHKPFTEFVASSLFFAALGLASLPSAHRPGRAFGFGLLIALVALLRLHYSPIAALLWLAFIVSLPRRAINYLLLGNVIALIMVGLLETVTWGVPFYSYYANISVNLFLDDAGGRPPSEFLFYLPRLVYTTAGVALLATVAIVKQPRRHLLAAAVILTTLLFHQLQGHKEMRFIYIVTPWFLLVFADWVCHKTSGNIHRGNPLRTGVAVMAGMFSVLALGNFLPGNNWLHIAQSNERGQVSFVRHQSNLWSIYRKLAAMDNVKGVLNPDDPYFNQPGYYYLHKQIPLYDLALIKEISQSNQVTGLAVTQLISHVVTKQRNLQLAGFKQVQGNHDPGEYVLFQRENDGPVAGFNSYRIGDLGIPKHIVTRGLKDHRKTPRPELDLSAFERKP